MTPGERAGHVVLTAGMYAAILAVMGRDDHQIVAAVIAYVTGYGLCLMTVRK